MDVLHRCCGVDVHKATVVACVIAPGAGGAPCKEGRTCGTMTADLLQLVDWLVAAGCTAVAMESTGSYWKPLSNLLCLSRSTRPAGRRAPLGAAPRSFGLQRCAPAQGTGSVAGQDCPLGFSS